MKVAAKAVSAAVAAVVAAVAEVAVMMVLVVETVARAVAVVVIVVMVVAVVVASEAEIQISTVPGAKTLDKVGTAVHVGGNEATTIALPRYVREGSVGLGWAGGR